MQVSTEERLQLLGQIAATISHEIHNPLNAILLHIDVLEEELQDPQEGSHEQLLHSVAVIKTRVPQLYQLIQEFLTMVRLADMARLAENLEDLLEAFRLEMREHLAASKITLSLENIRNLGQIAIHKPIFWQGLRSIVQHAMNVMPQGGTLALRGQRSTDFVQLDITLSGENLREDEALARENPFELVHYARKGLGLYLVHEIVTAHGGQLTLNTTSGQGITLTMRLPLLAAGSAHNNP